MSKKTEAPLFDKGDLIEAAYSVLGVQPHIVAGALYDVTEPLSLEAAKEKVEAFLKRPIEGGK